MNIAKLCKQTVIACASREAREYAEFINSPIHKYIDNQIYKAAARGYNQLSLNFDYIKQNMLNIREGGPTIRASIRHYRNEGFSANQNVDCMFDWDNDSGEFLIISWPMSKYYNYTHKNCSFDAIMALFFGVLVPLALASFAIIAKY